MSTFKSRCIKDKESVILRNNYIKSHINTFPIKVLTGIPMSAKHNSKKKRNAVVGQFVYRMTEIKWKEANV